jgi:hypothetical protein
MTRPRHPYGIPTPPLSYSSQPSARRLRAGGNSTHFEAVMKDHSQEDADPYSPLMCILLLLVVVAAIQFKLHAVWF